MSVLRVHFKLSFYRNQLWLWGSIVGLVFSTLVVGLSFFSYYNQRFYQNISVDQVSVGGLTKTEAYEKILKGADYYSQKNQPIISLAITAKDYADDQHRQELDANQLFSGKDYQKALEEAYQVGRQGNLFQNIITIIKLLQQEQNIVASFKFDQTLLEQSLELLKEKVESEGKPHHLALATSGNSNAIQFEQGEDGLVLLLDESLEKINQVLNKIINQDQGQLHSQTILVEAVTQLINHHLTSDEIIACQTRAENFVGSSLEVFGNDNQELIPDESDAEKSLISWLVKKTLNDQEIIQLLAWPEGINYSAVEKTVEKWAEEINRPAINAEFEYNPNTLRTTKFYPGQTGLEANPNEIQQIIIKHIQEINNSDPEEIDSTTKNKTVAHILLKKTEPEIKLDATNNLGINELIGFGESYYYGSISTRLHNINVASKKLNGIIIPPGEQFSFNKTVGEVNHDTGFQQAYVIRSGRTLMEFGGGVCQVSTTTFRALLDAGVNITRRLPHSYRVSYYELDNKPGYDATVYSGNVDLRFENDTPGHILITAEADSSKAYMTVKLYGTNDGRQTKLKNHKQWDYTAPPPMQEIIDESLAPGQRQKVENAIPGIKVSFDWVVLDADGKSLHEKTFVSHYQAWGEKWLVGI